MFVSFFLSLRRIGVPVSLTEYLMLLEALAKGACERTVDDFYYLARSCLVKDERNLDKFDRVFGQSFRGIEASLDPQTEIPRSGCASWPSDCFPPRSWSRSRRWGALSS